MISKLKRRGQNGKARYKTKQMTELHTFLQSVQGQHVTVQEIRDYFKDREIAVGTTTIYRIMRATIIANAKNVEN